MIKETWYYKKLQDIYSSKDERYQANLRSWNLTDCSPWAERIRNGICKHFDMNPNIAGIFDCCCGDGTILECFRLSGFKVKGFDISEEFVEVAHKKGRDYVQLMDAADVEENEPWYVVAFDAFEHLPIKTLDKLLDAINKFGLVLIASNYVSEFKPDKEKTPDIAIDSYDFYKEGDRWLPESTDMWEHFIMQPYNWWLQKLDKHLTNFVRIDPIPDEWDIIGRPHLSLFLYKRK